MAEPSNELRIANDFTLPIEAVTQTFALLAVRGSGKTYTSSVMVEEFLKKNLPVVILDPVGVWWGLRSNADGTGPGFAIAVLGGDHGDAPLLATSGEMIAEMIVEERIPLILDLSHFRKGDQKRFVTDFAETLYHRNREALHVVLDEADEFAPQRTDAGSARMVGAFEDIVRRGRARGLGVTMITQRPAAINKNVLSQTQTLIALQMTAPHDRKAIQEWMSAAGAQSELDEMMKTLSTLPIGTAWLWSPRWLKEFRQIHIRLRETFDSSATPEVGEVITPPAGMARIDMARILYRLNAQEAATGEKPAQRIKRLERENRELRDKISAGISDRLDDAGKKLAAIAQGKTADIQAEPPAVEAPKEIIREIVRVEWDPALIAEVEKTLEGVQKVADGATRHILRLLRAAGKTDQVIEERPSTRQIYIPNEMRYQDSPETTHAEPKFEPLKARTGAVRTSIPARTGNAIADRTAKPVVSHPPADDLKPGELRMIESLRQFPDCGLSADQLSYLADISKGSGTWSTYLTTMRRRGIMVERAGRMYPTIWDGDGLSPQERTLIWRRKLKPGARRMLDALIDAFPFSLAPDDLATIAEISRGSGTWSTYLSDLRDIDLIRRSSKEISVISTVWFPIAGVKGGNGKTTQ